MKNIKKVRKRIGFNFYKGEIADSKKKSGWDASDLFNYYIENNKIGTNLEVNGEVIEIEPNTLFKDNGIYFFQLSNLRNDLIPAKKKIGKEKEDLHLEEDEYIGEFTGIVYDSINCSFMIQTNKYGVGVKQATEYLRELRSEYLKSICEDELSEKNLELNFIVDEKKIDNIYLSKEIRKVNFKSSTSSLAAISEKKKNKTMEAMQNFVCNYGNVKFEISISVDVEEKDPKESKVKNIVHDLVDIFKFKKDKKNNLENEKLGIEVLRKENEDSKVELVDFLAPKLTEYINISIEPKKSIGRDFLRTKMLQLYTEKRAMINRILGE